MREFIMTETVPLSEGIEIKGKKYFQAVLRPPTIKDNLDAEKTGQGKGALYLSMCLLINMTVELREDDTETAAVIPRKELCVDLFMQLNEVDFERLQEAREYLKKKVSWSNSRSKQSV
jgi:hypothetical protein